MATAEELIVALRSEGAKEAQQDLEAVEQKTGDVGDEMSDTGSKLGGLKNAIKGFFTAILAGIAIAAGGLASKIPVLGELAAGFGAVVDSIALKLDSKLRPAISGITDDLFELSGAIADGDYEEAESIFKSWGKTLTQFDWAGLYGDLVNAVTGFITDTLNALADTDIRGAINDLLNGLGEAVDEANYGENFKAIITALGNFLKNTEWLGIASDIINFLGGAIKTFIKETDWNKWFKFIVTGIENWIEDVDWSEVATKIIKGIAGGFESAGEFIVGGLEDIIFGTEETDGLLDDAVDWGESLIESFIEGITNKLPDLRQTFQNLKQGNFEVATNGDGDSSNNGDSGTQTSGRFGNSGRGTSVYLDGRRLDEQQGRYGRSNTARRGI